MTERRLEKFRAVLARRRFDLTVVLENIHDPHNVSAILRSADACGVARVQLIYTSEVFPGLRRTGKKSSASANKWVLRRPFRSVDECYSRLREEGFAIYATRLTGKRPVSLYDLDLVGKSALVFGNEHAGVSDEAAEKADGNFMIPMGGMIESLNVSVACAVALFEAVRQRSGSRRRHDKTDAPLMKALREEWLSPRPRR
jgi:tRNA (guanosine-2'-O-)-methyltransferase